MRTLMKVLLLLFTLMAGMESATAQTTYTKWKQVQAPSNLANDDVVVIVDLTTSNAMRNNPKYDQDKSVSNESPSATKVTLKEEQDRIIGEVGDTLIWAAERPDNKYAFKVKVKDVDHYLFYSDQSLKVGYVSSSDAWKRKFELDKDMLYMPNVETGQDEHKNFHVGLKVASGIQEMMSGNKWELMADDNGNVSNDIAATKTAFFKKVETTLPDPTLHFPGHDYEADVNVNGEVKFVSPVAVVVEDEKASITYWSGNTDLAEVDASTGVVTVKKRGTVRIYAQVAKKEGSYDDYLTSYVLRIDDTTNNKKGCRTNPFTVAEAIDYAKTDHSADAADGVCYFVTGIVSSVGGAMSGMEGMEDMMDMMSGMIPADSGFDITSMMSMFMGEQEPGTITYAISDNGVDKNSLSIKNGRGLLWNNKISDLTEYSLSVGDWVTVFGPLEYSEDNDMMSMMGGGNNNQEKEKTVKMPRINYMSEHTRNLITEDISLYFGKEKQTEDLFKITDYFNGTLVTNTNAEDKTKPRTSIKLSDTDIAYWEVNDQKTDSLLKPKKSGIITVTVNAPVLLENGDTVKMKRKFYLDVRDRMVLPAGTMVGNYELVTDESQLQEGDKLLIVATIDNKSKVLNRKTGASGSSDSSNPMASMFGGSNASNITIGADGKISEVPDDALILTLEEAQNEDYKWLLQTGRTPEYKMTYLYVSDPDGGSTSMMGMGGSGAKLKTRLLDASNDSCRVKFTFLSEKNDSVKIQFNFADRQDDKQQTVTAKNVIHYEKSMMSTTFGGYEPESDKATLPRLYRLVQADEYPVTIGETKWATIVSSYDVTLPEGLTGYVVKEIDNVNNEAVLQETQGGLKAGEPYLLNAENAGTYTLTRADANANANIEEPETNLLAVSDNNTESGVYVLANRNGEAGFYKWTGGFLGAGRVYLYRATAAARAFIPFAFDNGDMTGIDAVSAVKRRKSNGYGVRDLQGRRMNESHLPKGIYIKDGEKFVVE